MALNIVERFVRKHRAPKGALRRSIGCVGTATPTIGQKAPSAKRCIKTSGSKDVIGSPVFRSESTERQKVH